MKLNLGTLRISSPAFGSLKRIPKRYTGEGEDISPPLAWSDVPQGVQQFALICFDLDAPLPHGFTHWVVYGIPPETTGIVEGQGKHAFTEGMNDFGNQRYNGPLPPEGHGPHLYYFLLYGLDQALDLKPGLNRVQLLDAIADHVTVQARLVGIYER